MNDDTINADRTRWRSKRAARIRAEARFILVTARRAATAAWPDEDHLSHAVAAALRAISVEHRGANGDYVTTTRLRQLAEVLDHDLSVPTEVRDNDD